MVQPRPAAPTVKFVDEYCQWYKSLFPDVKSFEAFKYLHVGCVSDLKRKTLPEIAKIVGLDNHSWVASFFNIITLGYRKVKNFAIRANFTSAKRQINHSNY